MATILVVDDRPTNRDFLVTLLGYRGHRLQEAADGAEALKVAQAARPDLIISDVLMPTMDGYEFVRQLRTEPHLAHTPVIFSTAHYLDREAKVLARQCGVQFILPKPCDPETVLHTVEAALGLTQVLATPPQEETFEREHLRLLTNQVARKAEELHAVSEKLAALLELGQHLVSEHDPQHLLETYCRGARAIIGAKWAAIGMLDEGESTGHQLFVSGLDRATMASVGTLQAAQGVLATILREHRPCRLRNVSGKPHVVGLPQQFPPIHSFLGVPIVYQARLYGWLSLVNKLGYEEFSDVDERLAVTLAAQVAVAHENTRLFSSMRQQATELTNEVVERRRAQESLQEQVRLAALGADVGLALTQSRSLPEMLQRCAEVLTHHLDAAFARVWTLNTQENILELQASAGLYTHLDGPHGRVPVGQFKIGLIAQERLPHLTNAVIGDPRVGDQAWARREGMVAFAGYPLLVGEQLVGVVAMFARQALTGATLEGMAAVANTIALGIERKQAEAEREQLHAQLLQAQKMEAIGTLAGGIAHDFNNILGTILGYSELALEDVPRDSAIRCNLQEVLTAGKRARDLVRQILAFSRKHEDERQPVPLHLIVNDTLGLLRASLPPTIDIHQHLETTFSTILADPTQMHQVVMNLCTNAAHAMRKTGGVLEVCLDAVQLAADFASTHPPLMAGPYLRLTVRDTGHGMESAILERIFEPFFTTKAVGEGTGLGLAVIHGIVANHGGAIAVTSTPGQGTTFDVYLPRADGMTADDSPETAVAGGPERILFVDDEAALGRWGKQTLERLGYDVVACTSGRDALQVLQAAPQAFDLLIADQTMPGMTGEALAQEVKRLRPALPIILCTGYSPTLTKENVAAMGIGAYLMKPIMGQDLARAIRQVLDQTTT